jgi:hypothetical protein
VEAQLVLNLELQEDLGGQEDQAVLALLVEEEDLEVHQVVEEDLEVVGHHLVEAVGEVHRLVEVAVVVVLRLEEVAVEEVRILQVEVEEEEHLEEEEERLEEVAVVEAPFRVEEEVQVTLEEVPKTLVKKPQEQQLFLILKSLL